MAEVLISVLPVAWLEWLCFLFLGVMAEYPYMPLPVPVISNSHSPAETEKGAKNEPNKDMSRSFFMWLYPKFNMYISNLRYIV